MKLKSVFTVVVIEVNKDEELRFIKDNDNSIDSVCLIRDSEPDPIDLFTEEEIAIAEEIAKDEFSKRHI